MSISPTASLNETVPSLPNYNQSSYFRTWKFPYLITSPFPNYNNTIPVTKPRDIALLISMGKRLLFFHLLASKVSMRENLTFHKQLLHIKKLFLTNRNF